MQRTGRPWTEAEIEGLKQAWGDPAWNRTLIATSLRRSGQAVATQAALLKLGDKSKEPSPLRRGQWTREEVIKLRALRELGTMNLDQIARELGRSVASCVDRATREKMPRKKYVGAPRPQRMPPPPPVVQPDVGTVLHDTLRLDVARKLIRKGFAVGRVVTALKLTAIEAAAIRSHAHA